MSGKRWRYKVGPYRATVTVEERTRGANVRLKKYSNEKKRYVIRTLDFPVRGAEGKLDDNAVARAKAAADLSNRILQGDRMPAKVPLGRLSDLFRDEDLRDMEGKHLRHVRRELELLETFLGRDAAVEDLGKREWNALRRARASGAIDARGNPVPAEGPCPDCGDEGEPAGDCTTCGGTGAVSPRRSVSPRTAAATLKVLRQVCRFGASWRREDGQGFLLPFDPT